MKLSDKLRKDKASLQTEVKTINDAATAKGGFDDAQTKRLDEITATMQSINQQIARAEQNEELLKDHAGNLVVGEIPETPPITRDGGGVILEKRLYGARGSQQELRTYYNAGVFFCNLLSRYPNNPLPESVRRLSAIRAKSIFGTGAFVRDTDNGKADVSFEVIRDDIGGDRALLQEGQNIYGGYLVPEQVERNIIDIRERYGVFRQKAGRVVMTSDTARRPRRVSGLTAYPVGEGAAGTETTQVWDEIVLTATKWMALTRMTTEFQEDTFVEIGARILDEIAYAFAVAEDGAGFVGDGTSTYAAITGLKNALAAGAKVTQGTSNTWAAQVLADHNNLASKMPDYRDAPVPEYYCNKAYYHQVLERLAMAAGGNTAIVITGGIAKGMFNGYPVNFVTVMPSATATTGITCYLGDLAMAAKFGDRRGVTISVSDQANVGGQSLFERDQAATKGTERFDIVVHERGTASVGGPINALITG